MLKFNLPFIYSHFLPTISLDFKLSVSVRDAIVEKLDGRFGELFKKDHYDLAAVTHQRFKLPWLKDEKERASAKKK